MPRHCFLHCDTHEWYLSSALHLGQLASCWNFHCTRVGTTLQFGEACLVTNCCSAGRSLFIISSIPSQSISFWTSSGRELWCNHQVQVMESWRIEYSVELTGQRSSGHPSITATLLLGCTLQGCGYTWADAAHCGLRHIVQVCPSIHWAFLVGWEGGILFCVWWPLTCLHDHESGDDLRRKYRAFWRSTFACCGSGRKAGWNTWRACLLSHAARNMPFLWWQYNLCDWGWSHHFQLLSND